MAGKRETAKAETHARVLKSATELFHHKGYEAVTLRHVAEHARVSTGSIYSNFEDKAALFQAAMGEPAPDVAAFLLKVIDCPAKGKPMEAATALVELGIEAERLRRHLLGHHA